MGASRAFVLGLAAVLCTRAAALQLIDAPTGLAWTAEEVERAATGGAATVLARAAAAGQGDCRTDCEAIQRVWDRLAAVIDGQQEGSRRRFVLRLHVVQSADVDAFAVPDGTLVLSEDFVRRRSLDDAQLAFVLAHEAAHVLLEHERQALTAALSLLPRGVARTVDDIYVEFGFNIAIVRLLEPVLHQAEFEADEVGLQLAAYAGYAPVEQLRFMESEAENETPGVEVVSTHPTAANRLARLRVQMPLAERIFDNGVQQRAQSR
jgi:Zn-dependent protease with chaperone function